MPRIHTGDHILEVCYTDDLKGGILLAHDGSHSGRPAYLRLDYSDWNRIATAIYRGGIYKDIIKHSSVDVSLHCSSGSLNLSWYGAHDNSAHITITKQKDINLLHKMLCDTIMILKES